MGGGHGGPPPMGGGHPGGPPRPQWGPPGAPGQPPHPYQQRPPHQPKKRRGCGCGCFTLLFVVLVLGFLAYLQFWDVWDWMYAIFNVGAPPGVSDSWVWD